MEPLICQDQRFDPWFTTNQGLTPATQLGLHFVTF